MAICVIKQVASLQFPSDFRPPLDKFNFNKENNEIWKQSVGRLWSGDRSLQLIDAYAEMT